MTQKCTFCQRNSKCVFAYSESIKKDILVLKVYVLNSRDLYNSRVTTVLEPDLKMLNHSPEISKNQNLQEVNEKNKCSTWPSINDMSNRQNYSSYCSNMIGNKKNSEERQRDQGEQLGLRWGKDSLNFPHLLIFKR